MTGTVSCFVSIKDGFEHYEGTNKPQQRAQMCYAKHLNRFRNFRVLVNSLAMSGHAGGNSRLMLICWSVLGGMRKLARVAS